MYINFAKNIAYERLLRDVILKYIISFKNNIANKLQASSQFFFILMVTFVLNKLDV